MIKINHIISISFRFFISCLLILFFSGCATITPYNGFSSIAGVPGVQVKFRGPEIIYLRGGRTHYFNNRWQNCVAFTLDGKWDFSNQEDALQFTSSNRFVGVRIYSTKNMPGSDPVSRAISHFKAIDKEQHGKSIQYTIEPFLESRPGAVLMENGDFVVEKILTPELAALLPKKYGFEVGKTYQFQMGMQQRVIAPLPPNSVVVVTTRDVADARETLDSLDLLLGDALVKKLREAKEKKERLVCWEDAMHERFPEIFSDR